MTEWEGGERGDLNIWFKGEGSILFQFKRPQEEKNGGGVPLYLYATFAKKQIKIDCQFSTSVIFKVRTAFVLLL